MKLGLRFYFGVLTVGEDALKLGAGELPELSVWSGCSSPAKPVWP
jgi:hypothetical protein